MHPVYVDKIGRQQFTTFEELLVLGRNEEIKKEQRRSYKPPPHPDQSLLNDAAYRGRKPSNKAAPMQNNQLSQEEGQELAAIDQNKNPQTPNKSSKKNKNTPPTTAKNQSPSPDHGNPSPTPSSNTAPQNAEYRPESIQDRITKGACWKCLQFGHWSKECDNEKFIYCYACATPHVTRKNCPTCNMNRNRSEN